MCGIFVCYNNIPENVLKHLEKIKHRGPDSTAHKIIDNIFFGFHRLAINGLTKIGEQPLLLDDLYLVCNGEIYNHRELETEFGTVDQGRSDCEVILHLYKKYGFKETIKKLNGVFAIVLYDKRKKILHVARDPIGVRPLFIGTIGIKPEIYFSSELKAIDFCTTIKQFPAGNYWISNENEYVTYAESIYEDSNINLEKIHETISDKLESAVIKRIQNSERPIGLLLSGGFDSSVIASMAQRNSDIQFNTFSIGFHDSNDLTFASEVAEYIGSKHHEVRYTIDEAISVIPEVIRCLETYDITTIRASVPMWLLGRYISKNTDIKVLLSGEGSDEYGSYLYFKDAPNENEFCAESEKLLNELQYFDVLRADRTISAHGLEIRVPFLDQDFMKYFLSIPTKYRMPFDGIEKYHLRKSMEEKKWLPPSVLWRQKDAFSDSVGNSWRNAIIDYVEKRYTDEDLILAQQIYANYNPPISKEALWYRNIFNEYYKNFENILPHYWMPNWQSEELKDPSATCL